MQFTLRPPHYNVTNYLLEIKKKLFIYEQKNYRKNNVRKI